MTGYGDDYLAFLRWEFAAGDGSFMQNLRVGLEWDAEAFNRLIEAMRICCVDRETTVPSYEVTVERWVAEGFWYYDCFVRQWVQNPNFPRAHADAYYKQAVERLRQLASWFFYGRCPCESRDVFGPICPV